MTITLTKLAELLNATIDGDATLELTGLATFENASAADLVFADGADHVAAAEASAAKVILADKNYPASGKTLLRVANVRVSLVLALGLFYPPEAFPAGVHPSAVIAQGAQVHPTAHIGPHVSVAADAVIEERCILVGGNRIGAAVVLGEGTKLHANVVVYDGCKVGRSVQIHAGTVIGSDGYGYVFHHGQHLKIPHIGNVEIGDDVEIGANTCIDRGALGATVIGNGTKIDNLVHIAHNVHIGQNCLILGQVGFAGSTRMGNYSVVASQSGIAGHLKIGSQATIGAKSGVMRDIPDKGTVLGIPASAAKETKRQWVAVQQLPELIRRVRALEARQTE